MCHHIPSNNSAILTRVMISQSICVIVIKKQLTDNHSSIFLRIVGPRCFSCSLIEGAPIPQGPGPIYTIAMRGLIVTASGLTKSKKVRPQHNYTNILLQHPYGN